MRLRLVSYNVKGFPWSSPPIQQIVDWAVRSSDVIVLQEVWSRHRLWSSAFSSHGWTFIKPPRETHIVGVFGSGLAVAWRSTDWSMSDARLYPFLSAVGFDSWVTKGWFRVELIHRATGLPLRLINTHMQSDYEVCDELWRPIAEPVRMAQALQLMETERRMPDSPTLIVGDMNTEMCWMSGSCGWITSHCGPTFPGTSQVLDHCTSWQGQPWTLLEHRVCRECDEWSDHWPVRWDVCWQGA
jgi:hypothetical protein